MFDLSESGMGFDFGPGKNRVLKDYREPPTSIDLKFGLTMPQGRSFRIKIAHDV